jgi:predicted PurR-regulated permease PerM
MMFSTIIVYTLIGLNYGIVAGVVLGTMEIVPYFGTFIGYLPVIFLSLSQGLTMFLLTVTLTIIIQQIKDNILVPKVVGESIGIHPLGIFISILIGAKVAGILGIFLAIPVAGVVQALINVLFTKDFHPEISEE